MISRVERENPDSVDDLRDWKRQESEALAQLVRGSLMCCECGAVDWITRSWRAYLTEDEPAEVVVYCPTCACRDFDE